MATGRIALPSITTHGIARGGFMQATVSHQGEGGRNPPSSLTHANRKPKAGRILPVPSHRTMHHHGMISPANVRITSTPRSRAVELGDQRVTVAAYATAFAHRWTTVNVLNLYPNALDRSVSGMSREVSSSRLRCAITRHRVAADRT